MTLRLIRGQGKKQIGIVATNAKRCLGHRSFQNLVYIARKAVVVVVLCLRFKDRCGLTRSGLPSEGCASLGGRFLFA
jgi:hypothetical protein